MNLQSGKGTARRCLPASSVVEPEGGDANAEGAQSLCVLADHEDCCWHEREGEARFTAVGLCWCFVDFYLSHPSIELPFCLSTH